MSSVVEICNLALSQLGITKIESLNEASKEAQECKLIYEYSRDAALEAHDWGFARTRVLLALIDGSFTGWQYAYQIPTDCLAPRKILDPTLQASGLDDEGNNVERVYFEKLNYQGKQIILTDMTDAELSYTARITDTNQYSPLYIEALKYKLAADLSPALRGKGDMQASNMQMFQAMLDIARQENSNQENSPRNEQSDFVSFRS